MKVSYNWLTEFFDKKLPEPEKLVELLTIKSFEIDGLEKVATDASEDFVIDVDVLPNRSHDCLSHYGIAKEISVVTGLQLNKIEQAENEPDFESDFKIKIHNGGCRRYVACEIKDLVIGESPVELKSKLEAIGQKSINVLVDITNIVMFETGQSMHAFDVDKLSGPEINVELAKNSEVITTLDNKIVELDSEILLIKDASDPLAIAGIKGGKMAQVTEQTKNIILESANFNPSLIRKTSRKIAIATESSKRFENEVTPELAMFAMNRAIKLISKYVATEKTKVSNRIDFYPKKWRQYKTGVSEREVNSLLGSDFSEKQIASVFNKLNFEYEIVNPAEKIVEEAESLLDRPYKYAASVFFDSPKSFDCSSFVSYVYSLAGYSIPRMSIDQFAYSERIEKDELLPGDLIFANTGIQDKKIDYKTLEFVSGTEVHHGVDHVGIYIGDGKVIHATTFNDFGVVEEVIEQSERFKNIVGYGRIIKYNGAKSESRFAVTVPYERLDIKSGPDLIEEVGRILGYEKIISEPVSEKLKSETFTAKLNSTYQISNWLRKILTEEGFSEIITYTFVKEGSVEPLKPIAEDKAFIRESLLIGMEDALLKNNHNADLLGLETIKLFEIGKVFKKVRANKIDSSDIVDNSEASNNSNLGTKFLDTDFAIEENLVLSLGVKNKLGIKKPKTREVILDILQLIGSKLQIDLIEKLDLKITDEQEKIEINLDDLLKDEKIVSNLQQAINELSDDEKVANLYSKLPKIANDVKYQTISAYPFMLRDIAVWVPKNVSSEEVLKLIKENTGDILVNHNLFDKYEKDEKISFAYHLVFQSYEKTLTDDEVNVIMQNITLKMQENGWEVR